MRMTLGVILLIAGAGKLRSSTAIDDARSFGVLPARAAVLVGWSITYAELALGGMLLLGIALKAAAILAVLLFTGFSTAMVVALSRGRKIRCRCFGRVGTDVTIATVIRNALLISASAFIAIAARWDPSPVTSVRQTHREIESLVRSGNLLPLCGTVALCVAFLFLLTYVDWALITPLTRGKEVTH